MAEKKKVTKILLAEDFELTRKLEIEALKELGIHDIIIADNGLDAIRKLEEENDVELIISDWNMPEMSGYEFLLRVRADKKHHKIPFIMATAQGEKEQARKAMEKGADYFLTKPFTSSDLGKIIDSIFSPKNQADILPEKKHTPQKVQMTIAHIQVTDHLALGVLKHMIDTEKVSPKYFELNTCCMSSWNSVQDSLEKKEADAAFLLAPLAMDLFSIGIPLKIVLLAHKNGSICVRNIAEDRLQSLHEYFKSRVFFLPHTMSVHHMLADMFLHEIGLTLGPVGRPGVDVFFEVVPPVKMSEFLRKNLNSCGFAVAEPFGSKAIDDGISELMFYSGDLWENHPCCVVAMRQEFVDANPDAVYEFVDLLAQAGEHIDTNPEEAARIAVDFLDPQGSLGLNPLILKKILTQPTGIRTHDLFPVIEDLDKIQRYMHEKMGIGKIVDLTKLVDTQFAGLVCSNSLIVKKEKSKFINPAGIVADIIKRRQSTVNVTKISAVDEADLIAESDLSDIFQVRRGDATIDFRISSDMKLINCIIQETKVFLLKLGFKAFSGINLILRELLINAVEHGNRNNPEKQIVCNILQMQNSLFKIIVEDEGNGFDYEALNMSIPENKYQVRKRGYPFIKAFSEEIEFNAAGNRITVYHVIYQKTCFDTRKENKRIIIIPSGDIVASEIDEFRSLLKQLTDEGYTQYRFDLSKVEDIDSVGLSAFIILARMLSDSDAGSELEIMNATRDIAELFRMAHMDESYRIE
ncbi:ABC transporter substrate-binding protein [Desulfobacterales bacterium HSG16]|nr:ABC transporter substrate-binding protein [Desulfobacterales bacterium HSG16]